MRICLLASGSRGNAIFIESRQCRILIDAGLAARELSARLAQVGAEASDLEAILVTHEHQDHCRGLGPLARRYGLPVCIHPATFRALPRLGQVPELREMTAGPEVQLGDMRIQAVPLTHDAASPFGYLIDTPEGRVGVATDLGLATRLVRERLRGCRVLVLEANHDERLLLEGPYPWHLKQRIRSNHGHLSNDAAAELLGELAWGGLEAVFLAHLSETNNTPEKARARILDAFAGPAPELVVGCQDRISACLEF